MAIIEAKPKYKQLKDILLERINSGEYQTESRFSTENMLVREFGVSKHTVLKAIGELVNENFLYRRQGAGTFVKARRNNMNAKKRPTVTILYYGKSEADILGGSLQLISGFERCFQNDKKFDVNIFCTNGTIENEIQAINSLASSVSGIAIITHFRKGQPHPAVDLLKEKKIPFVSILAHPNEMYSDNINFVASDNFNGGYLVAKHFASSDCDEVFMVMPEYGKYSIENYDQRLAGCLQGLKASNIKVRERNIINIEVGDDKFSFEKAGYKAASKIIQFIVKGKKIGIFSLMSDQVACGIIKRLEEEKNIKQNSIICGYDNTPRSSEWGNNFTSIESSISDIGYRGAKILISSIESGCCLDPTKEILPVKLIKRGMQ